MRAYLRSPPLPGIINYRRVYLPLAPLEPVELFLESAHLQLAPPPPKLIIRGGSRRLVEQEVLPLRLCLIRLSFTQVYVVHYIMEGPKCFIVTVLAVRCIIIVYC